MRKFIITILVIFASISVKAQDIKVELKSTVNEINKIVSQNKLFFCIDNDSVMSEEDFTFKVVDVKLNLKELDVDPFGDVYSVDLAYKNQYSDEAYTQSKPKYKLVLFNVFDINNFDEIFKNKHIKRSENQSEAYFLGENFDFNKLKSQLDKLKRICIKNPNTLTEIQAKEYVYWYYKDFETGTSDYETNNKYRNPFKKYTGDYVIEIKNCEINLTYNVYDFTFQTILENKKVSINLKNINSIAQGGDDVIPYQEEYTKTINSSLNFKKSKDLNEFGENINVSAIHPEEYNKTLIVKAFNKLLESCNKNN